ncbi:MAG: 3-oxoacyl-(acyl-carrier-protein) synthase [Chitinophagaceae bacterium]|nr:3-oxoacyl-(acyl-carrier-protein) synthase [Chitinophagaceae bacterium]
MAIRSVITGTGSYIPPNSIANQDFSGQHFYDEQSQKVNLPGIEVAEKLRVITGIRERRYAFDEHTTSELGLAAALKAIDDAGIDKETIDQIIVAQNFGDVLKDTIQSDSVPSIASRIKHGLQIFNPSCIGYDILFGCPGWLQGVITADAFIKAGLIKRALVIGAETLSRVIDIYDRDSMIFSDGAGAIILEAKEMENGGPGIIGASAQSHCTDEAFYIYMGKSYHPDADAGIRYIKMKGRKVYEYAVKQVPLAMKDCIDKSGISIADVKKIFIHQANEKMDEAIIKNLYKLYDMRMPPNIMPMNIQELGNSSVATIPTLYDMVLKNHYPDHNIQPGDIVVFASVGAGMNINAVCYRV